MVNFWGRSFPFLVSFIPYIYGYVCFYILCVDSYLFFKTSHVLLYHMCRASTVRRFNIPIPSINVLTVLDTLTLLSLIIDITKL